MSVLRKEMEKYRDVDEDELLNKLSEEELQRLEDELEELDPDVSLQQMVHEQEGWIDFHNCSINDIRATNGPM